MSIEKELEDAIAVLLDCETRVADAMEAKSKAKSEVLALRKSYLKQERQKAQAAIDYYLSISTPFELTDYVPDNVSMEYYHWVCFLLKRKGYTLVGCGDPRRCPPYVTVTIGDTRA